MPKGQRKETVRAASQRIRGNINKFGQVKTRHQAKGLIAEPRRINVIPPTSSMHTK